MKKKKSPSFLNRLKSMHSTIFGTLKWKSPPWIKHLQNSAKTSPKTFWGSCFILLTLIISAVYGVYWYKSLPKPQYVTASIQAPDITPNQETLIPNRLIVDFGIRNNGLIKQSVAPLNKINKIITEGIKISPELPGEWYWNSDSQLIFTPSEDWPADQEYQIEFSPRVFSTKIKMEQYRFVFKTKPFQAIISDFKFYQDPVDSKVHHAVATIHFNFPVNPEHLEKNTRLAFESLNKEKSQKVQFNYSYDDHKRVAYLHSEQIKIKDLARYLLLTLDKGVTSATGSGHLKKEVSKNVLIPDASNFLKVIKASASIIRNDRDRPEQVLTVETSIGIKETDFIRSVHLYLLPTDYPATSAESSKQNYQWQNPGEVTQNILALSTPLKTEAIPTEQDYSSLHSFKFAAQTPHYIYIKIDKNMRGFGGFSLSKDFEAIIPVPDLPKEISFLHQGSLLALNGEKKLSVLIRGVPAVKFNFARVLPDNVNQLVTQTQGNFNNPYFINPSFNQQNISQIMTETQQFDATDLTKQQYTALDIGKYLNAETSTTGPQGLFLLEAVGWDVNNNYSLDVKASRLILITDLGLLVKDNNDGSHEVFVQSITQGTPQAGVTVSILGKNGLPILSVLTDDQGRAHFPTLKDFVDDREPSVYLAKLNSDVSFIPFHNDNINLNYSKFDVGGIYTNNQELQSLSAYLFSDRGIYRPGDTVHVGMIIKQAYAQAQPAGLPLQATVIDSRGTTLKEYKFALNETGYAELDFATSDTSPTGQYTVNLYLVKDNLPQNYLGSTNINVAEFLPDRMRINAEFDPRPSDGWSSPTGLNAKVDLWNLYGAPAANRRISGRILLTPETIEFANYPDYVFADPLQDPKKPAKVFTETLADVQTNVKGEASFNLNLDRFEKATYQLTFYAEGFEADGGRSVTTQIKSLVSPLPFFIGYKPDGDLSFIKQNRQRTLHFIAVNPQLSTEAANDLKVQLVSLHPITTLIKKSDGTYQYQSVVQSTVVETKAFAINEKGTDYSLPTSKIGDYLLNILDKDNTVLSQIKFSIVGASQQPLAKNAELSVKLNKPEYLANEDIEIQITAPYTGSGLITIERDKVYASQWFKTETTNSVQTIHIPADFQGNGYVNVAFVRDWTSPEIFSSPLSYSVAPFEVKHEEHDIKIDLSTSKVARPGESFTMNYQTNKPGKIIVFAVDEGILQVGRYETPDPLAFFFQKHALEVVTQQTVDQILPKFVLYRELSAMGGDGSSEELANHLNPFKRKTDLPVAFWSGIIETDTTPQQLSYSIPDYFNGTLRIMAVAVSRDAVGATDTSAEIRGDFIINPNVPTFVAPGDEFEISASIANNVKDSGEHSMIATDLVTSPEIEIIGTSQHSVEIAEGKEQTVHYKLRARSLLGAAKVTFKASSGAQSSSMDATLSVRPASPYVTQISSGLSKESKKTFNIIQNLYPEHRNIEATMSTSPLILIFGLERFLEDFPYGCTEQLTSKAMPLLALNSQSWLSKDADLINDKVSKTIQLLSQRQMSNGGFSYWPGLGENQGNNFASIYAMHFLTEARAQGFEIPGNLFYNGIAFLKELASQNPSDIESARLQAYAIYILTRNELVTTNYLTNLQLFLQKNNANSWKQDITGAYIAATYELLKSYKIAEELISEYKPSGQQGNTTDFYDANTANAQYLYIIAKHFPSLLDKKGTAILMDLVAALNNGELNTVLSGYTSLALGAYHQTKPDITMTDMSMTKTLADNKEIAIPSELKTYQKLSLDADVTKISLINPDSQSYFYQLVQAGFDTNLPTKPVKQGLELFREYQDANGNVVQTTALGTEIEVHIHIRSLNDQWINNVAIEDLLPGGFEVISDSVKIGSMDYTDAREDRVNFFGSVDSTAREIVYKIKATNTGTFTVPPVYAEAMYNPMIKARGVSSQITVTASQ